MYRYLLLCTGANSAESGPYLLGAGTPGEMERLTPALTVTPRCHNVPVHDIQLDDGWTMAGPRGSSCARITPVLPQPSEAAQLVHWSDDINDSEAPGTENDTPRRNSSHAKNTNLNQVQRPSTVPGHQVGAQLWLKRTPQYHLPSLQMSTLDHQSAPQHSNIPIHSIQASWSSPTVPNPMHICAMHASFHASMTWKRSCA